MAHIIAFEGIDGTGKGTQMQLAAERLKAKGLHVCEISFPAYDTFFGQEIGKFLTGKDGVRADCVDGKSMSLWFALDRFESMKDRSLDGYDVVLINRYVLSNAVYQSIRDCDLGKPDLLDFVLELEYNHFSLPMADAHFVFDMDLSQAANNIGKKGFRDYVGGEGGDIYETIPAIQLRAREKYIEYASRLPNVYLIQCMEGGKLKSIDSIAELVDEMLCKLNIL